MHNWICPVMENKQFCFHQDFDYDLIANLSSVYAEFPTTRLTNFPYNLVIMHA